MHLVREIDAQVMDPRVARPGQVVPAPENDPGPRRLRDRMVRLRCRFRAARKAIENATEIHRCTPQLYCCYGLTLHEKFAYSIVHFLGYNLKIIRVLRQGIWLAGSPANRIASD